jgi:hypothetical protein
MVVARSEIRAARRMVQQLAVHMLKQWSSVSSRTRMGTHIVMKELYAECQHSMSFLWMTVRRYILFRNTLLTLLWSIVAWIPPSALLSSAKKSCRQLSGRWPHLFKFCVVFGECVCMQCFYCSLFKTFANETRVSSRKILLRNEFPLWLFRSKSSKKAEYILCVFMRPCEHFRKPFGSKFLND